MLPNSDDKYRPVSYKRSIDVNLMNMFLVVQTAAVLDDEESVSALCKKITYKLFEKFIIKGEMNIDEGIAKVCNHSYR